MTSRVTLPATTPLAIALLAIALLAIALLAGCGPSPQPRRRAYVDHMVFAPDTPATDEASVDADAVESVDARQRGRRRAGRGKTTGRRNTSRRTSSSSTPWRQPRCAGTRAGTSRSRGAATAGRLDNGCLLPRRGAGYVRRNRSGYGTDTSVAIVQWATAAVAKLYPRSVRVVIGALSKAGGGRLRGHRSHQSGRDVDIGYFASDNRALPHFRPMNPGNLDVLKSWSLLGALLSTGRVQYIFMDYELQVLFYRHLQGENVPRSTLTRIFQFPAGRSARRGIIRHARGHNDHFHIRFRCPPDALCR